MKRRFQVTRRGFLKNVGVIGAGALALPHILPSRLFGADAPSNSLTVALLGCGNRSRQLLPSILSKRSCNNN
jgi:hypothetical protein